MRGMREWLADLPPDFWEVVRRLPAQWHERLAFRWGLMVVPPPPPPLHHLPLANRRLTRPPLLQQRRRRHACMYAYMHALPC